MKFVPSFRPKGTNVFPKMLWEALSDHGLYPAAATLLRTSGKPLHERCYLIGFIGNEIDLLRARRNRVRALPEHVSADFDARERHGTVGIGGVDDLELEPVGRQIFECALEIERLERAVRVLARPYLGGDALPVSEQRLLEFRYVCFHATCPCLIAG